jgi:hypothetical protein
MLEGFLHGFFGDLVEGHAVDRNPAFFLLAAIDELFRQVRGNGFAFAVRVRRQINRSRAFGQLLELGHDLFFSRDDVVVGGEVAFEIDAQPALGQVFDVAQRGFDLVVLAQVLVDGLGLDRRFDDD